MDIERGRHWVSIPWALAVIGIYTVCFLAFGFFFWEYYPQKQLGPWGDMFSTFNAFCTGIAMLGVVAAIFLQKEELADTRRELQKAADAQRETAAALAQSAEAAKLQANAAAATLEFLKDTERRARRKEAQPVTNVIDYFRANLHVLEVWDRIVPDVRETYARTADALLRPPSHEAATAFLRLSSWSLHEQYLFIRRKAEQLKKNVDHAYGEIPCGCADAEKHLHEIKREASELRQLVDIFDDQVRERFDLA